MSLHPAEIRGYRELYLVGRRLIHRWERLAEAIPSAEATDALEKGSEAVREMLRELGPLTAAHDVHGGSTAQGGGAQLGRGRAAVGDRFLERNMGLRAALDDLDHVATLLLYLASVSENRGHRELAEFSSSWERRLRRHVGALRKALVALGADPGGAIAPLHDSVLGKTAHGVTSGIGTVGEWVDRRLAGRGE